MAQVIEQLIKGGSAVRDVAKHRTKQAVRLFARDEDGAMVIFSLFLILTMIVFAGLGVDMMRYELHRTKLQATLDRAILAAAHPEQENDRKALVLDYFDTAGLGDFIEGENIKVVEALNGDSVSAYANMDIHMPFLGVAYGVQHGFFGNQSDPIVDTLSAPAAGTAAKANALLEISFVVDVSGSMENASSTGNSKMYELRRAAKKFSNLLLCDPNDSTKETNCPVQDNKVSISLVPYSSSVTVGEDLLSKFALNEPNTDSYCATFAESDFAVAGISTTAGLRQSAKWFTWGESWKNNNYQPDTYNWSDPSTWSSRNAWRTLWSCYTQSWREITPLENSAMDLNDKIDALKGLGGTAIHRGLKWGTALVHHDTQSAISSLVNDGDIHGDFDGRPYNPLDVSSTKVVVLMTDGLSSDMSRVKDGFRTGPSPFWRNDHNGYLSIYNATTGNYHWHDVPRKAVSSIQDHPFGNGTYRARDWSRYGGYRYWDASEVGTAYQLNWEDFWKLGYTWRIFENYDDWLEYPGIYTDNDDQVWYSYNDSFIQEGNPMTGEYVGKVDKLLLDQCDATKEKGILIIGIELETPNTNAGVLDLCATDTTNYYHKVDADELEGVLKTLAADFNKLRLIN